MTDLPDPDPNFRPGLRIHPPETWDMARRDYLAGHSGPAVCARYGLRLATFRARAAADGWRRMDQSPSPPPPPREPIDFIGDLDGASYFDLAEMAAIHMREAIVDGRATEAASWMRLHFRLHEEHDPEAFYAAARDKRDELDGIDGVFLAPESSLNPETRPPPETPAPPPSSPGRAPGCDAESGRTGR